MFTTPALIGFPTPANLVSSAGVIYVDLAWDNTASPSYIVHVDYSSDGGSTWTVDVFTALAGSSSISTSTTYTNIQHSAWRIRYKLGSTFGQYSNTVTWTVPSAPTSVVWNSGGPFVTFHNPNTYGVTYNITFSPSGEVKTGSISASSNSGTIAPTADTDTSACVYFEADVNSSTVCT